MSNRPHRNLLPAPWQSRAVFEIEGRPFTVLDVIRAADIRGDLPPLLDRSRHAQACERRAAAEGLEPDMEAVESMMDDFRYARGLVTVEETERWLEEYGLTADDLSDHFLRCHWVASYSRRENPAPDDPDTVPSSWAADLAISGDLLRLAQDLAREAAGARHHKPPTPAQEAELLAGFRTSRAFDEAGYAAWRADWDLTDPAVAAILSAQRQFGQDWQDALTPARRTAALIELRTALTRIELITVQFDSAEAAHEAYLCATADGLTLENVAAEAGYPVRHESAFLRQFPEDWHVHLLGAIPGRTLPPLGNQGAHEVCRVLSHTEPQLTDPDVVAHLDGILLERQFGRLESLDVRWLLNTEGVR